MEEREEKKGKEETEYRKDGIKEEEEEGSEGRKKDMRYEERD